MKITNQAIRVALAAATLVCAQAQTQTKEEKKEVHTFQYKITADNPGQAGATHVIMRKQAGPGGQLTTVTEDVVGPNNFIFVGAPAGATFQRISDTPVKGQPFAADIVTETVQTLADGNRITSKQTGKRYRDSEGRTRQENVLALPGMWVPDSKGATIVSIDDPVSGEHLTLNTGDKMAHRVVVSRGAKAGAVIAHSSTTTSAVTSGPAMMHITSDTAAGGPHMVHAEKIVKVVAGEPLGGKDSVKTEDLGKRVIEGVECTGSRMTVTIPAGMIGNERAIDTVTETWYSNDLKMDVLRTHSDPRAGVTTYKVTGLLRGEQPRSLFEAPADVKVETLDENVMKRTIEEKIRQSQKKDE